jgi:hypothetical protein
MQEKNERRLHAWVTEALAERDYETVREILAMLEAVPPPIAEQPKAVALRLLSSAEAELPRAQTSLDIPDSTKFKDVNAWSTLIKKGFLVELVHKGRTTFITDDVIRWAYDNVPFTAGDLEQMTDGPRWRLQVSRAVRKLRDAQVVFQRGEGCRTYTIVKPESRIDIALGVC